MATNVSATYILKIMRPQKNLSQCFLRIMMHEKELIQMRVQFYVERNEDITAKEETDCCVRRIVTVFLSYIKKIHKDTKFCK